jgi:hypothetical protein
MCHASQDRNNMFEPCYMHVWQNKIQWFKYLNHVTSLFEKQDHDSIFESCSKIDHKLRLSSQHISLWSHFCCAKSIQTMAMSKFSKSSAAFPPSVRENPPFLLFPSWRRWTKLMGLTRTSLNGSSWSFSWIQTTQSPCTPDSLISSRIVRHNGMHKHSVPLYSVYIL